MSRQNPHTIGLTPEGRQAERTGDALARLAVVERSGGGSGSGGGGATSFVNEVTGSVAGSVGTLTINPAAEPQVALLGIGQAAVAVGTPLAITSTANADVTMTSAAASRSRHVFGETGLGNQWWAGKETGNSFRLARSTATSGNGSAQLNQTAIEVGSTIGAADIYLWNKTKIWAVPNLLYGNAALEIGTLMSGDEAGIASVARYRLSCSVSGYKDGSNGERDGIPNNDAITTDAVAGVDAASSYYFPITASNVIRGVGVTGDLNPTHPDKGSAHQFVCFWDVQEPVNMDAYCEVYTFASVHNLARRGVLASGCEQQMNIAAGPGTYGHAGPARASGWCLITEDENPYSAYSDNTIFATGSAWQQTAARGLWVLAKGPQRGGTGIYIDGRHVEETGDTAEWQRAIVVNVGSDNGVAGTDVWMVDGKGNMGLGVTVNQTQNVTGLPARITFGSYTAPADGIQFGLQNPTTLYRINSNSRLRLENLTGDCEVEINPEAAGRGRFIFSDATVQKWSMGKEADNAFAIGRIGSNPPPTGMQGGNAILVGDLATDADVSIYNKVKIWASTPNMTFGNAALDVGCDAMSGDLTVGTGPASITNYRISCGADAFVNGTNGTRNSIPNNNAIDTDAACLGAAGASFYFPFSSSNTVGITDVGSLNTYLSAITLTEPTADAYVEAYGFTSLIYCHRRGALVSGGEMQMNVYAPVGAGKGGPARASGLALICNESNTYGSYASSTIFGAGSPWQSTGMRGQWIHNGGSERGGTGIFISSGTDAWERALVVNVGSFPNVNGTDVLCIDGAGNLGLGVTNDQVGVIGAKIHFAASTAAAGGIQFGSDTNLYRSAANQLKTDDLLISESVTVKLTAGVPVDADFTNATPPNGTVAINSSTSTLYARVAGAWTSIVGGGGGGSVATDTIWAAKGDLAVGTGADAATILGVGTNGTVLVADSSTGSGLKWSTSVTVGTTSPVVNVLTPTTITAAQSGLVVSDGQTIAINAGGGARLVQVSGTYTITGEPHDTSMIGFNYGTTITLSSSGTPTANDLNTGTAFYAAGTVNLMDATTYGNIAAAAQPWSEFRAATNFTAATGGATATMLGGYSAFNATAHVVGLGFTMTTHRGLWAQAPIGSGTITTLVGVDIEDLNTFPGTKTNTPISLRSLGTVPQMHHAGPVKLGATGAPAASTTLDVTGTLKFSTSAAAGLLFAANSSATTVTTATSEAVIYLKGNNLVVKFLDAGTTRFKYLDLSGTGVTFVHSTTEP